MKYKLWLKVEAYDEETDRHAEASEEIKIGEVDGDLIDLSVYVKSLIGDQPFSIDRGDLYDEEDYVFE